MSLEQLNVELRYLQARQNDAGRSVVAKLFGKEIAQVEELRRQRFGVKARG